jgi:tetratricopeptide (TPR) repeat protein
MRWQKTVAMAFLAAAALAAPQQPQNTKGTAAAKAEFDKGAAALRESDWDGAVAHYGKAVELDPDFFDAHEQYVFVSTSGPKNYTNDKLFGELEAKYLKWIGEHPDKAVLAYSLGHVYTYRKPELAVHYFQQAVKIDPQFAPAWDMLGITAEAQGKLDDERVYERKAAESWPENVRYARHAADAWMMADFALFRKASMDFVAKYPNEAVGQLSYLAMRALRYEDSKSVWEEIRRNYMPQGAGSLAPLFQMYVREDPPKALKLAAEAIAALPQDKSWPQLAAYAQAVIDARAAIEGGHAAAAVEMLDKVTLPPRTDRRMLDVTRAQALAASGRGELAYDGLLQSFGSKPTEEARAVLLDLGAKSGKSARQVDGEVYKLRAAAARASIPFSTTTYPDRKPVKLDDYAGKVFLLNFWYPMCGPCRGEFPSLQAVLDKYRSRGFRIVAANIHPKEDAWVMPLMEGWKLGFLPVRGDDDMVKAYNVKGAPSNFLYGPDGKIYYVPGPVNTVDARRELEMQIDALLDQVQK